MTSLERLSNGSLFRALNASETAMILGGQEMANTFVRGSDGSLTYVGSDLILDQPAQPAQPSAPTAPSREA